MHACWRQMGECIGERREGAHEAMKMQSRDGTEMTATWLSATMNPFLPCSVVVGDAQSSTPLQPTPPSDSHAFSGLNDPHFIYRTLSRDLSIVEARCYPTIDSSLSVWVSGI